MNVFDNILRNSVHELTRERSNEHVRHIYKQCLLDKFPTKKSFDMIKDTCIQIMRKSMNDHSEVWFESKYSNLVNEIYEEPSDILSDTISIDLHNEMKLLYEQALLEARDKIVDLQRKISNNEQSIQQSATPRGRGAGRGSDGDAPTGGRGVGRGSGGGKGDGGKGDGGKGDGGKVSAGRGSGGGGKVFTGISSGGKVSAGRGSGGGGKVSAGRGSGGGGKVSAGRGSGGGGKVSASKGSGADSCMYNSMKKMSISMDEDQLEEFKETICSGVNDVHNSDSEYDNMRRTLNDAHVMRELRRRHGVMNVTDKETETIASPLKRDTTVDTIENEDEKITEKGRDEDNMTALPQSQTDGRLIDSGLIGDNIETLKQTHIDENFTLECPICLEPLCTDVTSKDYTGCCIGKTCGHALCSSCWKKNRKSKICPVCRRLLFLGPGRRPDAHVY